MDGAALISFLNIPVGETIDDDTALDLLNNAKDIIEMKLELKILETENSDNTFGASEDYLDAKSLPSNFLLDQKVVLGSGDSFSEYLPCDFKDRRRMKNSQRYYIDYKNNDMYICGSVNTTETIYLYYLYQTDDLTTSTSPVWPAKFHKLIPFLAAELYKGGIDVDVINLEQSLAMNKQAMAIYQGMKMWDAKLKLRAMAQRTPIHGARFGRRTSGIIPDFPA